MKKRSNHSISAHCFNLSNIKVLTTLTLSIFIESILSVVVDSWSMQQNVTRNVLVHRHSRRLKRKLQSNLFRRSDESVISSVETINVPRTVEQKTSGSSCSVNGNGFFGYPSRQAYEVSYFYQATVTSNTSTLDIVNTIAPELDLAITNAVLPYLFVQCSVQVTAKSLLRTSTTSTNNHQLRGRSLQESFGQGEPTITAISANAVDQFLFAGGCKYLIMYFTFLLDTNRILFAYSFFVLY
jgi:hypothetical protein